MSEQKEKSLFEYYGFTKKDAEKYPVVSKILKELTSEKIKKEVWEIGQIKLSPELRAWAQEYQTIGDRSFAFWQLMFRGHEMFSFWETTQKHKIVNLKFLVTMLVVLFDDVADRSKDMKLLDGMLKVVFGGKDITIYENTSSQNKKYLAFTLKIRRAINQEISTLPSFSEFGEVFEYDICQTLNAIKYSCLINRKPHLINKTEYWLYAPHTLQGLVNCTLDLMCFDKASLREAGAIREVFWNAQKMGRISNCLSTWKDELIKADFTSTVLAYAVDCGLVGIEDLCGRDRRDVINKIGNSVIEKNLLREWENSYNEICLLCGKIKSVDIGIILQRLEHFLVFYLSVSKFNDHRYNN